MNVGRTHHVDSAGVPIAVGDIMVIVSGVFKGQVGRVEKVYNLKGHSNLSQVCLQMFTVTTLKYPKHRLIKASYRLLNYDYMVDTGL